jgi:hypothetical protein
VSAKRVEPDRYPTHADPIAKPRDKSVVDKHFERLAITGTSLTLAPSSSITEQARMRLQQCFE